jgi:hypothetical protein
MSTLWIHIKALGLRAAELEAAMIAAVSDRFQSEFAHSQGLCRLLGIWEDTWHSHLHSLILGKTESAST